MLRLILGLAVMVSLSACATLEPEPCTDEWVDWNTERLLTDFSINNYRKINRLKDFSEALDEDASPLLVLQIPDRLSDFESLATDFGERTLPKINAAIAQCATPQELTPTFIAFLRKEGVNESVLEWADVLSTLVLETRSE